MVLSCVEGSFLTEVLTSTQLHTQPWSSEDLLSFFFVYQSPFQYSVFWFLVSLISLDFQFHVFNSENLPRFTLLPSPISVSLRGNYLKALSWGRCRTHFVCFPSLRITVHHFDNCCFILFCMGFYFISVSGFGCLSQEFKNRSLLPHLCLKHKFVLLNINNSR